MNSKIGMLAAILLLATGCDRGPQMAPVTGKVTYEGKVVPVGTVTFYPGAGGRPSSGQIQPDGSYELSSSTPGDGAVVGDYKIAIEARRVDNAPPAPKSFEEELAQEGQPPSPAARIEWLVPQKYSSAQSSGLTATVSSGPNEINFHLP